MKRFDARTAVLQALKDKGLYRDTKENPMVVPICRYAQIYILRSYCNIYRLLLKYKQNNSQREAYMIPWCL